ncbi:G kinase-anchoring protein 1-like [Venturia canescens]|uniref:G kinase-anchoring protein 1-like n=1 Tax=Venturia canescens TaxID=32260 RepID=UPI001C9C6860|nr:G kinase-anchoring protein 1-like [Venturia canescens]
MATAVPSRFAVLSIDDDDFKPKKVQKPSSTGKSNPKGSKNDKQKQQPKKDEKKKTNKNKKKKGNNETQQWEQWKQKDSMAIEETYEQELHQAILLSKLAYEAQGENGRASKDQDDTKKAQSNKKSKKATMSLEEFNNLGASASVTEANTVTSIENKDSKTKVSDTEFFDRVERETKNEITKSKEKDILKSRFNQLDDDITSAQLKVEVEKRDDQITQLRLEVESLKDELTQVKNRNRKLYQILSHGEMKDKASVLAEVTKLQEIREELTLEVTSLHAQLEQERSKTRASSTDAKTTKQNNKKRPATENA